MLLYKRFLLTSALAIVVIPSISHAQYWQGENTATYAKQDDNGKTVNYYTNKRGQEQAAEKSDSLKNQAVEIEVKTNTPKYNQNITLPKTTDGVRIRTKADSNKGETEAEKFKRLFEENKKKKEQASKLSTSTTEKPQEEVTTTPTPSIKGETPSERAKREYLERYNKKKKEQATKAKQPKKKQEVDTIELTGKFVIKPISSTNYKSMTGLNHCYFKYQLENKTNTKLFKADISLEWADGLTLGLRFYKNAKGDKETSALAVSGDACDINTNKLPEIKINRCKAKGITFETCKNALDIEWRPAAYER